MRFLFFVAILVLTVWVAVGCEMGPEPEVSIETPAAGIEPMQDTVAVIEATPTLVKATPTLVKATSTAMSAMSKPTWTPEPTWTPDPTWTPVSEPTPGPSQPPAGEPTLSTGINTPSWTLFPTPTPRPTPKPTATPTVRPPKPTSTPRPAYQKRQDHRQSVELVMQMINDERQRQSSVALSSATLGAQECAENLRWLYRSTRTWADSCGFERGFVSVWTWEEFRGDLWRVLVRILDRQNIQFTGPVSIIFEANTHIDVGIAHDEYVYIIVVMLSS